MREIILITIAITFYSFVGFVWAKFGILKSISESYYKVGWLFPAFCLIVGIGTFAIAWIDNSFLLASSGGALVVVGVLPEIKIPYIKYRHIIAAVLCIILSQLAIYFNYHDWQVNVLFVVFTAIFMIFKKRIFEIWWEEVVAFTCIFVVLI